MTDGQVLVLEDDVSSQMLIKESLKNYDFFLAEDIRSAKNLLSRHADSIDAMIIDIHLPDGDGLRFLHEITHSGKFTHVPCLVLSGDKDIAGKVMAFSSGAEDFITKPFDPIELNARVSARIQRSKREQEKHSVLKAGDLKIDLSAQKVFLLKDREAPRDLELTSKEVRLLSLLVRRFEVVFSREHILTEVWKGVSISDRTVDSHIAHLRKKIAGSGVEIETLKGIGYLARLKEEVSVCRVQRE